MWGEIAGALLGGGGAAPMSPDQIAAEARSSFQGGPLVVGSKQVGGRGNDAGATSAAQAMTPTGDQPAAMVGQPMPDWLPWVIVAAIVGIVALFSRR